MAKVFRGPLRFMAAKKTTKKANSSPTPKKKAEAPKASPTPKKGRGGPRGPRAGSKTSFILSQPVEMLAKDVVEAGAKAGLEFSDKFVWSVRSAAKSKGAPGSAPAAAAALSKATTPKRGPGRPKKSAASSNTGAAGSSREEQLFALCLGIGIARAEEIVASAREQISGLRL